MGTLASELIPVAARGAAPRVYADANIPSGAVGFMRTRLGWDVLFVMEHDELRGARDIEHNRLGRTLLTQDRDYEREDFPPAEGAGVIVFIAQDERRLCELLGRADRELFRCAGALPIPLEGRKMRWHIGAAEIIGDASAAR